MNTVYCVLLIPALITIWVIYITFQMIFNFQDTAYSKSLTLQGYNYYKADVFFVKAIKKSEYFEGKRKEKEEHKEYNRIKKQLRNS